MMMGEGRFEKRVLCGGLRLRDMVGVKKMVEKMRKSWAMRKRGLCFEVEYDIDDYGEGGRVGRSRREEPIMEEKVVRLYWWVRVLV